jgi:hypothetical protein
MYIPGWKPCYNYWGNKVNKKANKFYSTNYLKEKFVDKSTHQLVG